MEFLSKRAAIRQIEKQPRAEPRPPPHRCGANFRANTHCKLARVFALSDWLPEPGDDGVKSLSRHGSDLLFVSTIRSNPPARNHLVTLARNSIFPTQRRDPRDSSRDGLLTIGILDGMEVNFFNRRIIESNELCLAFEIVQDLCPRDRYSDSTDSNIHSRTTPRSINIRFISTKD